MKIVQGTSLVLKNNYVYTCTLSFRSFGLLILALLTEKVPFYNLIWEEGVRTQLVTGGAC